MSRTTVTVGPRVEFDTAGYVRLRVYDRDLGTDRPYYLHRLVAWAHGLLDGLDDPRHVHHLDGDRWHNHPANLRAAPPDDHANFHLNGVDLPPVTWERCGTCGWCPHRDEPTYTTCVVCGSPSNP